MNFKDLPNGSLQIGVMVRYPTVRENVVMRRIKSRLCLTAMNAEKKYPNNNQSLTEQKNTSVQNSVPIHSEDGLYEE
jgi:hypothetical protein